MDRFSKFRYNCRMLGKLFGFDNPVKAAQKTVENINALEKEFEALSREQLREKTKEWRDRLRDLTRPSGTLAGIGEGGGEVGRYLDQILPEAFAAVREAAKRTLGQRHYDVQLVGGIILHQGKISEMKTGEGKTLAATLPVFLNALSGRGVHLVTVND